MPKDRQSVIVAVHGVGAPEQGSVITELSHQFPDTPFTRDDVLLRGKTFARLSSSRGETPDLLEVNWSDIKRPPKSLLGIVEWTIALSIALARADLSWSKVKIRTLRIHAYFLEAVLLWIVFPVLIGFMHANLQSWSRGAADAVVIVMASLTYWVSRKASSLAANAGIVTVVLLIFLAAVPQLALAANPIAVRAYGFVQIASGLLITITALEIGGYLIQGKIPLTGAMGRLALTYLPLALLSALGSCIWAVSLNVVSRLREWEHVIPSTSNSRPGDLIDLGWRKMFSENLGYDLKSVEFAMAGASSLLGCFVIASLLAYRFANPKEQGEVAHRAIFCLTVFAPLSLLAPGIFIVLTSRYAGNALNWNNTQDVLYVYTISALRILPWIVAAATGINALLDVLSNVVFYITDRNLGLSSYEACNARLAMALTYAESTYDSVHVLAHSQGTVIALTTLLRFDDVTAKTLTTMGSPLRTLYAKYLGWPIERPHQTWWNLFREGDYIGGSIGPECTDKDIGAGEHTQYFCDERIRKWLGIVGARESDRSGVPV